MRLPTAAVVLVMDTQTNRTGQVEKNAEAQQSLQYYRAQLLSPAAVRQLSRLRPGRMLLDVAGCWAAIVAAWLAVAWHPVWWVVLLAMLTVGSRYYALFIIGHDGMHRRLFNGAKWNDVFNDVFVLGPIGAITRLNNRNHLDHHLKVGTAEDPDRHKHSCFNKDGLGGFVSYLAGLHSVGQSLKHVFGWGAESNRPARYNARDLIILLGWQAALLGGLWAFIGWWAYPLLWLAPVYLFTFLADNVRSFAEHSHPENDATADRHRLITFQSNPFERVLFAPMNMNYHIAHHLWPSIPYYNLAKADAQIRNLPAARGLIWRRSYLGYLASYFLKLPLLECKAPAHARSS